MGAFNVLNILLNAYCVLDILIKILKTYQASSPNIFGLIVPTPHNVKSFNAPRHLVGYDNFAK